MVNRPIPQSAGGPHVPFDGAETEGTLIDRLARVAAAVGDDEALFGGGESLSYSQLLEAVEGLGRWFLAEHGPGAEPIALLTPHAPVTPVVELASIASGRPAMPLDPTVPAARLQQQLDAARPVATVVAPGTAHLVEGLRNTGTVLCWGSAAELPSVDGDELRPTTDDAAFVMFTSGTTGESKGVVLNHRALLVGSREMAVAGAVGIGQRAAAMAPLAFGAGLSTVVWGLMGGASVGLFPMRDRGVPAAVEWLRENDMTVFATVPTVGRALAAAVAEGDQLSRLRGVIVGGEPVRPSDVAALRRMGAGPVRVFSVYASTELMLMSWGVVEPDEDAAGIATLPIGRPVDGFRVEVRLREEGGDTGEIVVVAPELNRGYVDRPGFPALAAEQLEDDRFLYATGDLGRLRGSDIELVGRVDSIVKVRGSRVELGLVEDALQSAPDVGAAAVVAVTADNGDVHLVGHVTGREGGPAPDPRRVRGHMRLNLPAAMVPLRVVVHDRLPLLPNGKPDRDALSRFELAPVADHVEPSSEVERRLLKRLRVISGLDDLGVTDDLFERGVDSLVAIEILVQIEEEFGVSLPTSSWIDLSTVADLARAVEAGGRDAPASTVVRLQVGDPRRPPIIVTNDLHGSAIRFRDLARALGEDQPVYALDSPLRDGFAGAPTTMSGVAAVHAADLVATFGEGPFHVLGYSWGTMLAVELAAQLRRAGKQVGFLGLIDYGPVHLRHRTRWDETPLPPDGWRERAPSDLPLTRRVAHHVRRAREEPPGRRMRYVSRALGQAHRYDWYLAQRDLRRSNRVRPLLRSSYTWYSLVRMALAYDWPPVEHDVSLFVCDQTLRGRIPMSRRVDYASATDPTLGWDRLVRGELVVRDVVGHHNDLVEEPYVDGVGAAVRERFDEWLAAQRSG